jgi:hypothetical protein
MFEAIKIDEYQYVFKYGQSIVGQDRNGNNNLRDVAFATFYTC